MNEMEKTDKFLLALLLIVIAGVTALSVLQ